MGLKATVQRWVYVYGWRARYWWYDTREGAQAHIAILVLACFVAIAQLVRMSVVALTPPPSGQTAKAVYWWVIQLIIVIVAAAIAYSMRPKAQPAPQQDQKGPTTEDGQAVKDYFGECWIDDEFLLAWKIMGKEAIKSGGGKK